MQKNSAEALTISPADNGKALKDFFHFPYNLYKSDPHWPPPLRMFEKKKFNRRTSPFLQENPTRFFVCRRDASVCGRVAVMENLRYNRLYPEENAAFFGFFECVNDPDVASLLLQKAMQWACDRGCRKLIGPVNYTVNEIAGLLIHGFDAPPAVLMPYNPPWCAEFLKKNGFSTAMRFLAYETDDRSIRFPSVVNRLPARLEEAGYSFRSFDLNNVEEDVGRLTEIFNQSWKENWGFIPFETAEMLDAFHQIRSFIVPELIQLAEFKGEPIAFSAAIPDINQALLRLNGRLLPFNFLKINRHIKEIDQIRVLLMGVAPAHRNKGIDLILYKKLFDIAPAKGYHKAELSWILENNVMMNKILHHIGARVSKSYTIFEKYIRE